ncbi:MAG: sulfatase, partial [Acidobacteriota bacterium]
MPGAILALAALLLLGGCAAPRDAASPSPSDGPPRSVVLIVLDTLRADRLGSYGHDQPTSPRLDAWAARRAVRYERALAPAPWTLPSHVALFTGLPAHAHGVDHVRARLGAAPPTLAAILRDAGYRTAAFTGGAFLTPAYGLDRGFETFVAATPDDDPARELTTSVRRALDWLDQARIDGDERPFFLFLHTFAVHRPLHMRRPDIARVGVPTALAALAPSPDLRRALLRPGTELYAGRLEAETTSTLTAHAHPPRLRPPDDGPFRTLDDAAWPLVSALYDAAIRHADRHVGRFLDALTRRGLDDDTLVIVTSDHGEALGEGCGTPVGCRGGHGFPLTSNLRVPLFIADPAVGAGPAVAQAVDLTGLLRTILDRVGVAVPMAAAAATPGFADQRTARDGWIDSYAGANNFGLTSRYRERLQVTVYDAPWDRLRGRLVAHDLRRDPEAVGPGLPLPDAFARALRA